ncbi:hypothetical protein ABZ930_36975 [Streptomyces sp. NPDC046716]|uniref:hypothetical protein n=1 Tax=Streptomyces sp. NPDC046716 TaxID=3157093 RepID=UPI0033E28167
MHSSRTLCLAGAGMSIAATLSLSGCAKGHESRYEASASTVAALEPSGWVPEPTLSGAESAVGGEVEPAACRDLFRTLDRRNEGDAVSGFHSTEGESYLLIRDWSARKTERGLSNAVLNAARACPKMKMACDSAELSYSTKVIGVKRGNTRLMLTARDESGEIVVQILISATTYRGTSEGRPLSGKQSRNRLTRVMNSHQIGPREEHALSVVSIPETGLRHP